MTRKYILSITTLIAVLLLVSTAYTQVRTQLTPADYERANAVRTKFQGLTENLPEPARAIQNTPRFWYRKSVKGGSEFVLVDAEAATKKAAFDHEKLAASLNVLTSAKYTAITLPFNSISFVDNERAIEFAAEPDHERQLGGAARG
jgi:hypothetical protein